MNLLNIYKASAGSGKTYRLSMEFLKYVIQDPTSFERILAVTFTNKATAEMKTRIITSLYGIAKNLEESENDFKALQSELTPIDSKFASKNFIISQARKALSMMLHNYSHFHIETIDSFFQMVLRNLEKELGLGTHLNIELDQEPILAESAESLLDDIPNDSHLRGWVQQYLNQKLEEDKSWNITGEIANFGKVLFSESFKTQSQKLFDFLERKDALKNYRKKLNDHQKKSEEELISTAQQFFDLCKKNGFTEKSFYQGSRGIWGYFQKIAEKKVYSSGMNSYVLPFFQGDDTKLSKLDDVLSYRDQIFKILDETEKKRPICDLDCTTIELINDNLFQVGLLHYLDKKMRAINKENNQFMLSDTQALLNVMVQEDDAPFIYEKIGAYLDHIMIDEFQDTSETQWRNFKPLIAECASRNMDNLVVGDPKQSIYRFRNGKWELLGKLKQEMSHITPQEISLDTNWRSHKNIVGFNNKVFSYLPECYQNLGVVPADDSYLQSMIEAYQDATQKCIKERHNSGYVKVDLMDASDRETYEEKTLLALADEVKRMQTMGIKPEQMVILIRTNNQVPMIAEYFSYYKSLPENSGFCFDLISEDAYRLESSDAIQAIISALRYIASLSAKKRDEKEQKQNMLLSTVQLLHSYQKVNSRGHLNIIPPDPNYLDESQQKFLASIAELKLLPLYEMVEEIYRIMGLNQIKNQENYYCFFLDRLNDFLVKKSSNLRLFLRQWDDTIHKMTIPSGESSGIKIMSIHKSKGLEFHTVFIPFCDWEIGLNPRHANVLWENTDHLPSLFNDLPFTAVKCGTKMLRSYFDSTYMREMVETYMDNLNVLYVALTRAEKNMVIFGKKCGKEKDGNDKMDVISHLLQKMFMTDIETVADERLLSLWKNLALSEKLESSDEMVHYELGSLQNEVKSDQQDDEEEKKKQTMNPFKKIPEKEELQIDTYSQKGKFKQSNKSNDFIGDSEENDTPKNDEYLNRGKVLHYLFSLITSSNEVEKAVNQLEFEGLIRREEKSKIIESVQRALATEQGQRWFRPGLQLYNECSILFRNEEGEIETRRPDRVIREGNQMTVIDFKFGKPSPKYKLQVEEYESLLRKMGYDVTTHIWYLDEYFPMDENKQ